MSDPVVHTYPDALVIFVKGFRNEEIPRDEDVLVVSNLGNIKEVSSVSVMQTVKNNPGSFALTIVDTANRYIVPDDPETEVATLYARGNTRKIKSFASDKKGIAFAGANYYEFPTYKDWLSFEYGTLQEPGTNNRYMIFYRRDKAGTVTERYAFDNQGNIINVVRSGNTTMEAAFQNAANASTQTYTVQTDNGSTTRQFVLYKNKNEEFITKYKDTDEQGIGTATFKRGRCKISPMDRVVIFMTKRFNDDGTIRQAPKGVMLRRFTGLVNTVQQGYSENNSVINVQGEDVTKFLRTSVINVNPSLILDESINPDANTQTDNITIWSQIFKGMRAPAIIRLVTLGSGPGGAGEFARRIDGVGNYSLSSSSTSPDLEYDPNSDSFITAGTTKKRAGVRRASIRGILGDLFTKNTVHIFDPFKKNANIEGFRPYEISLSSGWQFYQSDFKPRRDLAYQIADDTHFVFYADRNGHIWFHPPRFSNGWLLGAAIPQVYVIDSGSVISSGFIEDDQNIYSSVYVSTEPSFGLEGIKPLAIYDGAFKDDTVQLKFGQRILTVSNPLIRAGDREAITLYAKSVLQRMLAGKYQGQITMTGRPEIDPGRPVYVPFRNMMYYLETVEHSLTFGSQCVTTLHLSYGRKPWEHLPEVLSFSANDEVYLTDGHLRIGRRNVQDTKQESLSDQTKTLNAQAQRSGQLPFQFFTPDSTYVFVDKTKIVKP